MNNRLIWTIRFYKNAVFWNPGRSLSRLEGIRPANRPREADMQAKI